MNKKGRYLLITLLAIAGTMIAFYSANKDLLWDGSLLHYPNVETRIQREIWIGFKVMILLVSFPFIIAFFLSWLVNGKKKGGR